MIKFNQYIAIVLFISVLILISGCCGKHTEISDYEKVEILAKDKFVQDYEILLNQEKSLLLCRKIYNRKDELHFTIEYFIFDIQKEKVILEEQIIDAHVNWFDNENIELNYTPEIISGDEDIQRFIINVRTKEKKFLK